LLPAFDDVATHKLVVLAQPVQEYVDGLPAQFAVSAIVVPTVGSVLLAVSVQDTADREVVAALCQSTVIEVGELATAPLYAVTQYVAAPAVVDATTQFFEELAQPDHE
jgi:hypothetical protein